MSSSRAPGVTIMGGDVSFRLAESPGNGVKRLERYAHLLDRAIALDPANPKAHILRAEAFHHANRYDRELASLNRAKALGTPDPWLLMGYGRYYLQVGDYVEAYLAYEEVSRRGHGSTPSQTKAYVNALVALSRLKVGDQPRAERLKHYAPLALNARHPDDGWTPQEFAFEFLHDGMHDEAIKYARAALKSMDFSNARMTLGAALYAKAAALHRAGAPTAQLQSLVDEARSLGVDKRTAVAYLVKNEMVDALRAEALGRLPVP
jgi:tetratricopeptide (TPR) repeat protein